MGFGSDTTPEPIACFQWIANPRIVLTYNPYDVDGSGSSDAKSLHSRLLWRQYATLQKSGEQA